MSEERNTENGAQSPVADDEQSMAAQIEALRREAEENYGKFLRAAAELDNFRKRSARDVEQARKYGAERLASAILPVRDSLEAGLKAAPAADSDAVVEGVRATLRLFDQALADAGIREISPQGELFDPNKHEALSLLPSADAPPNTVVDVVQKGYELNDRLLRAAKVIVSQGPPAGSA
jgi:molecular chaperone GrpE